MRLAQGLKIQNTVSGAFDLNSVSGLQLWAKNATDVTLNGGNVSQWNDQSGNSNHLTQATASLQPAYSAGEVDFDGTDDKLGFTQLELNEFSIFMVINLDAISSECLLGDADSANYMFRLGHTAADKVRFRAGGGGAGQNSDFTLTSAIPTEQKILLSIVRDSADTTVVRQDSTQIGTTGGVSTGNAFVINQICAQQASTTMLDGKVYEMAVYNRNLTGSDLTNVENDIKSRNGI